MLVERVFISQLFQPADPEIKMKHWQLEVCQKTLKGPKETAGLLTLHSGEELTGTQLETDITIWKNGPKEIP